jgi:hypothetical protein
MSKQKIIAAAFILMAVISFSGCKKDSTDKNEPDRTVFLKNQVWTGGANYPGKAVEPITISFQDGGILTWSEVAGDFIGTWQLDKDNLTISVGGSVSFKATISSSNQLTNIKSSDAAGRTLVSATLNEIADPVLDNTIWNGPSTIMQFTPGSKVNLVLGATSFTGILYTRKEKSIRFNVNPAYKWFLVTSSSSTMNVANIFPPSPTVSAFSITRQ